MEWRFVLGLGSITLVVIGLVVYGGLKLSKAVQRHAPDSVFTLNITPAGNALYACMVGLWILCLATRALKPESSMGAFLGGANGVTAVVVASIFFCGATAGILNKLGYPIAKKGGPKGRRRHR